MMYLNERIDDLQRGGLRVIQRADAFRFGTDAVLLADFAAPRRHDRVCDLGTGTGIIPLLLYARENTISADAVEIQPDMADMAARSVAGRFWTVFRKNAACARASAGVRAVR